MQRKFLSKQRTMQMITNIKNVPDPAKKRTPILIELIFS